MLRTITFFLLSTLATHCGLVGRADRQHSCLSKEYKWGGKCNLIFLRSHCRIGGMAVCCCENLPTHLDQEELKQAEMPSEAGISVNKQEF